MSDKFDWYFKLIVAGMAAFAFGHTIGGILFG